MATAPAGPEGVPAERAVLGGACAGGNGGVVERSDAVPGGARPPVARVCGVYQWKRRQQWSCPKCSRFWVGIWGSWRC